MILEWEQLSGRTWDCVTLGRVGVDFYAREAQPMGQAALFEKQIGGSPGNIAAMMAKLGGSAGMISVLSDDALGWYVRSALRELGIDDSQIPVDRSGSRTSLAVAETRAEDCEVVIYRHQAADLRLSAEMIDQSYLADAKSLVVSGTALAQSPSREAALLAMRFAREVGTLVVLDLDYRPYSWTGPAVTALYYDLAARWSDIVIGNREEFDAAEYLENSAEAGPVSDAVSARRFLGKGVRLVVMKRGKEGVDAYLADGSVCAGPQFRQPHPLKPYGAGDAFAGTLLYKLLRGAPVSEGLEWGAAAAAIVVGRLGCALASPSLPEIEKFIQQAEREGD